MNILSIDTSGVIARVGLLLTVQGAPFYSRESLADGDAAGKILSMIDAVLNEASLRIRDITLIACVVGPGSYTGTRIGVATAKGLSDGNLPRGLVGKSDGIPCVPISSLEILAYGAPFEAGTLVAPTIDARNGNVYTAIFRRQKNDLAKRLTPDAIVPRTDLPPEARIIEMSGKLSYAAAKIAWARWKSRGERAFGIPTASGASGSEKFRSDALSPAYLQDFLVNNLRQIYK